MKKFKQLFSKVSLLVFVLTAISCCKKDDPVTPVQPDFYFGADMSSVNMIEDYGAVYRDSSKVRDPFVIFRNHGCNVIRVRLFHNPDAKDGYSQYYKPGYCGLKDAARTIQRAKDLGMKVCLDFHYSDTWADPANQKIPKAWQGLTIDILKDSLYNYTFSVLNNLKAQNLTPEMVQIGNEIDPGLLLPIGKTIAAQATLFNSGIQAVRNFSQTSDIKPKIIIHYADNEGSVQRFQTLINNGVNDFDIMGISYYDQWTDMKFAGLTSVIKLLKSTFKKEVMVVETFYQWTNVSEDGKVYDTQIQLNGYPVTPAGQHDYLIALTQSVIDGGGSGVFYWEPAWISSSLGYGQEIKALFDFNGNTLSGIDFMNYAYNFK
ncbi:MAG TPA: glycosyl hydrolase 53 family protein [Prolixibacteraceae bacterium]|nr:glycosyl hydrolase 53 family protein [Prolixibacteraceae bacterium]HPS13272.1 glycosyl hydrolase 53 family protein [Prolixibacteraceae bacterium]